MTKLKNRVAERSSEAAMTFEVAEIFERILLRQLGLPNVTRLSAYPPQEPIEHKAEPKFSKLPFSVTALALTGHCANSRLSSHPST
jgi:hypothetical protein